MTWPAARGEQRNRSRCRLASVLTLTVAEERLPLPRCPSASQAWLREELDRVRRIGQAVQRALHARRPSRSAPGSSAGCSGPHRHPRRRSTVTPFVAEIDAERPRCWRCCCRRLHLVAGAGEDDVTPLRPLCEIRLASRPAVGPPMVVFGRVVRPGYRSRPLPSGVGRRTVKPMVLPDDPRARVADRGTRRGRYRAARCRRRRCATSSSAPPMTVVTAPVDANPVLLDCRSVRVI